MGKILSKAWELPQSECFQSSKHTNATLSIIGEKLDQEGYKYGRHGWEDFAKDIGGVYNRHIHRYVHLLVRKGRSVPIHFFPRPILVEYAKVGWT